MSTWTIYKVDDFGFRIKRSGDGIEYRVSAMISSLGCIHDPASFNDQMAEAAVSILNGEQKPANAKESPLPPTVWRKSDGVPFDLKGDVYYHRTVSVGYPISHIINSGEFSTSSEGLPSMRPDWVDEAAREIYNERFHYSPVMQEVIVSMAEIIRAHAPK